MTAGVVKSPTPSTLRAIDTTLRMNRASEKPRDITHSTSPRAAASSAPPARPRSFAPSPGLAPVPRWSTARSLSPYVPALRAALRRPASATSLRRPRPGDTGTRTPSGVYLAPPLPSRWPLLLEGASAVPEEGVPAAGAARAAFLAS
ncbi:hypothetical protein GCM10012287_41280 [Streptomyces daqingensis]|uniref:Uncharacterized protein n=1 Tax=Streptomyces daqingensis TaxID=1472640 RepID=A0ABQ2MPB4_9ACTN|nr:hypothetical protein GCM10012287_41280 [Streptomyces daqingensis]